MSTRACYSFSDNEQIYYVYKHHDGYPEGAIEAICRARLFAWELPRFEADEFAAAFIAANKGKTGGGIRLTHHWNNHCDLEYFYEITSKNNELYLKAFRVDDDKLIPFFEGNLKQFNEGIINKKFNLE